MVTFPHLCLPPVPQKHQGRSVPFRPSPLRADSPIWELRIPNSVNLGLNPNSFPDQATPPYHSPADTEGPRRLGSHCHPRLPASRQRQRGGARRCLPASRQRQHLRFRPIGPLSRPLQLVSPGEPGATNKGCLPAPGQRQHTNLTNPGPHGPGIPQLRSRFHVTLTTPRAPGLHHIRPRLSAMVRTTAVSQPPSPNCKRLDLPTHPSVSPESLSHRLRNVQAG